jgi:hypothetical protein
MRRRVFGAMGKWSLMSRRSAMFLVKLYSRPGNDLTPRFPQIVGALARLRPRC